MLSHRAWINTYLMEMLEFGFGWNETFLYATPLTHAGGCLILPVLLRGGRCVILDQFRPEPFMQVIEQEKVTMTFLVPTMIYLLLDHPRRDAYDLGSLRNIIYGAAAIAPNRLKQALETFGPVLTQLFGQTEAPMTLTVLPREEHLAADPAARGPHPLLGRPSHPAYRASTARRRRQGGVRRAPRAKSWCAAAT
jgi:fatty-acyl-CoA synthase